jgi:hypothetical protein
VKNLLLIGVVLAFVLLCLGCIKQREEIAQVEEVLIPAEVVPVRVIQADEDFVTFDIPQDISCGFYRVVVERSDNSLFSVLMSVYVEPGTEVELYDLRYYQNRGNSKLILIAKPKKNPSSQPSL